MKPFRKDSTACSRELMEDALKHLLDCDQSGRGATVESLAGALGKPQKKSAEILGQLRGQRIGASPLFIQRPVAFAHHVQHGGATIVGPLNLPSTLAEHASEMYAKNLLNLASPWIKDGALAIDWNDEVYAGAVLTHGGAVKHAPTAKLVGG